MVLLVMPVLMGSCSDDDDDDDPSAYVGKVNIRNSSSMTLYAFMVHYINDGREIITTEDKGTLKPNEVISVDIPIGATKYYMSTFSDGDRYFSPDYSASVRQQVITDQNLEHWHPNN